MYKTNYRLETIGVHATVLTAETGKWTTGIGADTKISIGRYPIPADTSKYRPIRDTSIGLTLQICSCWLHSVDCDLSSIKCSRHRQPLCLVCVWSLTPQHVVVDLTSPMKTSPPSRLLLFNESHGLWHALQWGGHVLYFTVRTSLRHSAIWPLRLAAIVHSPAADFSDGAYRYIEDDLCTRGAHCRGKPSPQCFTALLINLSVCHYRCRSAVFACPVTR